MLYQHTDKLIAMSAGRVDTSAGRGWSLCLLLGAIAIVVAPCLGWAEDKPLSIAAVPSRPGSTQPSTDGPTSEQVARDAAQVSKRYQRLEEMFLRLAELTGATDPGQADLLRKAMVESKQRLIAVQFEQIVERLQRDQLGDALAAQKRLREDLKALLELLLSDVRADRIDEEQQQVGAWLEEIKQLISRQRALRGRTEQAGDELRLADDQQQLADRTEDLRDSMTERSPEDAETQGDPPSGDDSEDSEDGDDATPPAARDPQTAGDPQAGDEQQDPADTESSESGEADPSDSGAPDSGAPESEGSPSEPAEPTDTPPPGESGAPGDEGEPGECGDPAKSSDSSDGSPSQQGDSGSSEGEDSSEPTPSQQRLNEAKRRMRQAREQLEQSQRSDAVKEQNEALRELQQAKAELEETLRQLREEEIAQMLAMLEARFRRMLQEQAEIYESTVLLDKKPADQRRAGDQVQAVRLSGRESQLATTATAVLQTLRDDGSTTALPETVEQVRDDMQQVADLVSRYDTGNFTQAVQQDIITGLEELIAAVQQAQDDQEERQQENQQAQATDQPPPKEETLINPLQELRMIRLLQLRVNRRTSQLDQRAAEPNATPDAVDKALKDLSKREKRIIRATRAIGAGAEK